MIIKTITCHDVYNSGSSLQAYSLMKYLESLNHEVEIIDYKPDYLSNHYKLWTVSNTIYEENSILKYLYLIAKLPKRILELRNKKPYDKFKTDYLKITEERYVCNEELKRNLPKADVYIAGSDQIWNTTLKNGKDPAFYLDFVPDDKNKISYAASFSTESIPKSLEKNISEMVNRLNSISVREISGLNILEKMDIRRGVYVLDPVFLLGRNHWGSMCLNFNINEKYILVYDFDSNILIEQIAKKISNKKNLKIYTIYKSRYSDKHIKNIGPLEFISYIKNAEYVISNSFHATAFSIIFEKEFFVVNRTEKINTRMRDLLKILGIESRLIDKNFEFNKILKNIEYTEISSIIEEHVKQSKKYIIESLNKERLSS